MNRQRLEELTDHWRDGCLTEAQASELNLTLRESEEARRFFRAEAQLHGLLHCAVAAAAVAEASAHLSPQPASAGTTARRNSNWLQWRPLTAAAAGIVLGVFCATLAWAVASPRAMATASRLFALVDGSFESLSGRVASGFPSAFGVWSGDEAEVVSGKAMDGTKALRFVRAEGDAAVTNSPANSCDVYLLVDLGSLKADAAGGEATLELSAQFLDARAEKGAVLNFTCRIHVFAGSPDSLRAEWPLTRLDAVAFGADVVQSPGGAPHTWRSVTAKVLLPVYADFAVVQLVAGKAPASDSKAAEFGQQFADDVRLTLKTQPKLPVRLANR